MLALVRRLSMSVLVVTVCSCSLFGPVHHKISTLAGTGAWTSSGDGGPATKATIMNPNGIVVDAAGTVFFSDSNAHRIRKIDTKGVVTALAGSTQGYGGDGGAASAARFDYPQGLAMNAQGDLYVSDSNNCRIRCIAKATQTVSTVAGGGQTYRFGGDGGQASVASLSYPTSIAFDSSGVLFVADSMNNRIRKIATDGVISTVAGNGTAGAGGDGGAATAAELNGPWGVAVDSSGAVYVADTANNKVRKIDLAGNIHTVAGTGAAGSSGDGGAATAALLNQPKGVLVDGDGNLYIADWGNSCVREVSPAGTITTVAGKCGTSGWNTGDGQSATEAKLMNPIALALDSAGNLIVADEKGCVIRVVAKE